MSVRSGRWVWAAREAMSAWAVAVSLAISGPTTWVSMLGQAAA
ncbi:hypothetical protein SALBM217S_04482 [Streptomyces griseoloalbus]